MEERLKKVLGEQIVIRRPDLAFGDYAVFGGPKSAEIAEQLKAELTDEAEVSVAGGFVNILLSKKAIGFRITEADVQGEAWGRREGDERVMVEYTDPNPFKEMHIGHLMSNAIGETIARLIENSGAKIVRANYQGDVGPHVAKALWGLRQKNISEPTSASEIAAAYVAGNVAYEGSPEAKQEIDELNKAIYMGDNQELMTLWSRGREISLEAFEEIYKRLGTKFDYYFFESETSGPGMDLVRMGLEKGIFEESEGAVIYKGEKKGLHTLVFITSKGTPTYEAKELGLALLKEERWSADRSLIITANEQIGHFKVVKAALEDVAPLVGAKTTHVPHGFLRLTTGKMSSREGNVITAESFLKDIIEKASEKNPDPLIAEQVAIGAIKYMILRQAPGSDIIFDPEKSLSLEGDSGPYLQYALVRAKKILSYSSEDAGGADEPEKPYRIERIIIHYPEVAARAAKELSPNILTTYLTELAGEWNSFYANEQVLGSAEEQYKQRLTRAFANTMLNGLTLLGIPTPMSM